MQRRNTITSNPTNIYRNLNVGSTGASIKASAGYLQHIDVSNNAASPRFVKFYNKATAPTVGTDTPVITLQLAASSTLSIDYFAGIPFSLGIGIGAVTGVADNNTTNTTANDVVINVYYQ